MTNKLNDQVRLRHGATLTNRIVLSPMQSQSGLKGGFVSEDTIRYYSARSEAGGLLITEFHYVSENGGPSYVPNYPEQLGAYSDKHLEGLKQVAKALKSKGHKAILQIHHGGRRANGRYLDGKAVLSPSPLPLSFSKFPVREISSDEIEAIILDFGRATKRAIDAGFDGVEIHGANHYLLQQFFSKSTNKRMDYWGGSLEKRMHFPLAVIQEVKKVIKANAPEDFILGYRLSPEELHTHGEGYNYHDSIAFVKKIIPYELDYLHLSLWAGYNSKPEKSNQSYAELFKTVLDEQTKLIIVGGVFDESAAKDAVENYADLIAIARGTLIEPQFGKKIVEGRGREILHEISPESVPYSQLTDGLLEAFSRDDSIGLPPLPGANSIRSLHTGKYDQ